MYSLSGSRDVFIRKVIEQLASPAGRLGLLERYKIIDLSPSPSVSPDIVTTLHLYFTLPCPLGWTVVATSRLISFLILCDERKKVQSIWERVLPLHLVLVGKKKELDSNPRINNKHIYFDNKIPSPLSKIPTQDSEHPLSPKHVPL